MMNIKKIKIVKGRTSNEVKDLKKKIKKLGKTFLSKFIIMLTSKLIIPEFYLQILKYERNNRTRNEINKTLPFFETLEPLNYYINLKENDKNNNSSEIILDLAWNSFYKYKKKMSIIKKANEDKHMFYLILNGNLTKLHLIFEKHKLSIEEYLIYMIKMKYLQENQILNKCNKLNNDIINIDINNFEINFIVNNTSYDFKDLKNRARKELKKEGFKFISDDNIFIPSLEKYIKLFDFNENESNDTNIRYNLYIGKYIKSNILSKGYFIGDLSKNENDEGYSYICNSNCDICYINKMEANELKLYKYIQLKMLNIFKEIKHKFYILKDTNDYICSQYLVPFMIYRTYKKGEKIIIEKSQYEGIYFIIKGKVKISVSQTYNELSNTLISLQYSIFNFKDYVSELITKPIDILNEFNLEYIINNSNKNIINLNQKYNDNDIFSSNEYINSFKEMNHIDFYELKEGDILGLNELYDYKTELYNFNAECLSDEVTMFFVSKTNFNNIIKKESSIMNNVIQLIDFKAKALIGKINLYKDFHKKQVIKVLKNKEKRKMLKINSCLDLKVNRYSLKFSKINNNKEKNNLFQNKFKLKLSDNGKSDNTNLQNNIKLFKNNKLLKYLKNSSFLENDTISYEKDNKNNKNNSQNKNIIIKNGKRVKNYSAKTKESNIFLSSQNLNDSSLKIKEIIKMNTRIKNRNNNNSYSNKTLYYIRKNEYNIDCEQKRSFSNLPLIQLRSKMYKK